MEKKVLLLQGLLNKLCIPLRRIAHALFLSLRVPFNAVVSSWIATRQWISIHVDCSVFAMHNEEFENGSGRLKQRANEDGSEGVYVIPTVGKCWGTFEQKEVFLIAKVYRQGGVVFNVAL